MTVFNCRGSNFARLRFAFSDKSCWEDCLFLFGPEPEKGTNYVKGSGYGYGTVPGGLWAIDTEGGHVVDSVSRM